MDWIRKEYGELREKITPALWAKIRKKHLALEPDCRMCMEYGEVKTAVVVDHIIPHRGDIDLFLDPSNLQSLCIVCHNVIKRKVELTGGNFGCDINGWPLGPDHYWNGGVPIATDVDYSPVKTLAKKGKLK